MIARGCQVLHLPSASSVSGSIVDSSNVSPIRFRFGCTMKSSMSKLQSSPFLLVVIFIHQFAFLHAGPSAPVVIWCPSNQSDTVNPTQLNAASNPLQKLSSEDFERTLFQLGKIIDMLIVADELCIEDFKDNKVLSNATNSAKLYYLPCVDTPYSAFRKTFIYKQMKTIEDINDDHELNMILKDTDSSTCIALTGKECRYSHTERIKREVVAENSTEFKIKTDRIILYSSKPLVYEIKGSKEEDPKETIILPSSKATASSYKDVNETLVLSLKFSDLEKIKSLTLEFLFPVLSTGYYSLQRINYEAEGLSESLETKQDIYFPYNFSYHCSLDTIFMNSKVSLILRDMQVQVDSKNVVFNDAYDCVGFTSIPIWTGIFVTAILALIMIWALTMIMDIRTMDRFDDPKGKTITISAAE